MIPQLLRAREERFLSRKKPSLKIVLPMRELKIVFAVMKTANAASTPKEGST